MNDPVRERWRAAAGGWRRRADSIRQMGMPVSAWMIDRLDLQPGHEVLELAAGPGDTGFLAAELVRPTGRLISSDAVEEMLEVARERAKQQGIDNVEFRQLELEWIDLPTASMDAVLCRWGIMFLSDPSVAAGEMRRVLRPGGRVALAVWDTPERNPWASLPRQAVSSLGYADPPPPGAPDMFALAQPGRLASLLEDAGFTEVDVESIQWTTERPGLTEYLEETLDLSRPFAEVRERLGEEEWTTVVERMRELVRPFASADGGLRLPAQSLVAAASA